MADAESKLNVEKASTSSSSTNDRETAMASSENATDGDEIVTMQDVLDSEQAFEDDTQAVLGASDDVNCNYDKGYVKRQALYTCTTCIPVDSEIQAGICLACSYKCHENHTLVELYTKRQFRCDCGNSKFPNKCALQPDKDDVNPDNAYNQNYKGLYCICQRPYPDPEDTIDDEMLQCCVCEDWYHLRHLVKDSSTPSDFDEIVCHLCMTKYTFLNNYAAFSLTGIKKTDEEEIEKVDVSTDVTTAASKSNAEVNTDKSIDNKVTESISIKEGADEKHSVIMNGKDSISENAENAGDNTLETDAMIIDCNIDSSKTSAVTLTNGNKETNDGANISDINKKNENDAQSSMSVKPNTDTNNPNTVQNLSLNSASNGKDLSPALKDCKMPKDVNVGDILARFWPAKWRSHLCKCEVCMGIYKQHKLEFLLDELDTVAVYEETGKQKSMRTQYEAGMQALSSLDRIQQVEVISEYNNMKEQLVLYLKKFADNRKVVREEDIKEFFSGMQARKRHRPNLPYFCR